MLLPCPVPPTRPDPPCPYANLLHLADPPATGERRVIGSLIATNTIRRTTVLERGGTGPGMEVGLNFPQDTS